MKEKNEKVQKREDKRFFRVFVLSLLSIIVLSFITGVTVFFYTLQGEEQVLVPNMVEEPLLDALLELQKKELVPRVQVRFSSDLEMKGKVIEQKPSPGTLVKAGKDITLVVSKGAVIDRVEDFVGKDLQTVKIHLQTLFTTYKPLLKIKEPVMYVYDSSPAGTILKQKPKPGVELTGLTELELVVSRGPKRNTVKIPDLTDFKYSQAISILAAKDIPFIFELSKESDKKGGFIVEQSPKPETEVVVGKKLQLKITKPKDIPADSAFGIFDYVLPDSPVAVELKVEAISPMGERTELFSMEHPGGAISFPYMEKENTVIVLSIYDNEVIRHIVRVPDENEKD